MVDCNVRAQSFGFDVTDAPEPHDLDRLSAGLAAFNEADVGASARRVLAVLLRDPSGVRIDGGLSGYTAWGWLFVQWLWLPEVLRGQGLAAKLLDAAETESRTRGCQSAWIDTFNPVARRVYERAGYEVFGELPDFPKGRSRVFLQKRLAEPR